MTIQVKDATGTAQTFSTVTNSLDGSLAIQHNIEGVKASYIAVSQNLVPVAAGATDYFVLGGSATKTIRVTRIMIQGTATAVCVPVFVFRRASLDTGGTQAATTALPVARGLDGTEAAATAVPNAFVTVNPTIVDAAPHQMAAGWLGLAATTVGVVSAPLIFDFGVRNAKAIVLRGATAQLCINLNTTAITAGLLATTIEWTEE